MEVENVDVFVVVSAFFSGFLTLLHQQRVERGKILQQLTWF